jgi:DNA-3-methyladenine glycosylase
MTRSGLHLASKPLPLSFYARRPDLVACELLGKTLVRRIGGEALEGVVVETEAYFGLEDPASRAYRGMKEYNRAMWGEPGRLFVYNVHRYWMLNVVAHEPRGVGGVLFRALEPTKGIGKMIENRSVSDPMKLTSGPGRLSVALEVTQELNGIPVADPDGPVVILDAPRVDDYCTSRRIGVMRDLEENLRFYKRENKFVSR